MATLAQVALAPGPGENAWQVCGILPCIFWSTDELEAAHACSLSRSESAKGVDLKRVQDERSHGFNLWKKEGEMSGRCKVREKMVSNQIGAIESIPDCRRKCKAS